MTKAELLAEVPSGPPFQSSINLLDLATAARALPEGWEWHRVTKLNPDRVSTRIVWEAWWPGSKYDVVINDSGDEVRDRLCLAVLARHMMAGKIDPLYSEPLTLPQVVYQAAARTAAAINSGALGH